MAGADREVKPKAKGRHGSGGRKQRHGGQNQRVPTARKLIMHLQVALVAN